MPNIQVTTPVLAGESGAEIDTEGVNNIVIGIHGEGMTRITYKLGSTLEYTSFVGLAKGTVVVAKASSVQIHAQAFDLNYEVYG